MKKIYVINPNSSQTVTEGIDQAMAPLRIPGGPEISCLTLKEGPPGIQTQQHIDNLIAPMCALVRTLEETAAAFVIACFSDPGLYSVREISKKPVLGIAESGVLTALTLGLVIYTSAFIAEIVRAGIQSVNYGQTEAAEALGLKDVDRLRLVIIPQAMRVIIPPLTSQYLNLTKNSSLGAAIGFPELVSVFSGTALNQSGRAVEIIGMTMLVYLVISLLTSIFMNWYNARVALVQR